MCSRQALDLKRLAALTGQDLLDEERVEAIRKKIAAGFYNRNDVQKSIAERLAHRLADDPETGAEDSAADSTDRRD